MTFSSFMDVAALAALLCLGPAFARICRGPQLEDRLLGLQALGSAGTALLLLLAQVQRAPVLFDVALAMALLSAVTLLTLVRVLGDHSEG